MTAANTGIPAVAHFPSCVHSYIHFTSRAAVPLIEAEGLKRPGDRTENWGGMGSPNNSSCDPRGIFAYPKSTHRRINQTPYPVFIASSKTEPGRDTNQPEAVMFLDQSIPPLKNATGSGTYSFTMKQINSPESGEGAAAFLNGAKSAQHPPYSGDQAREALKERVHKSWNLHARGGSSTPSSDGRSNSDGYESPRSTTSESMFKMDE